MDFLALKIVMINGVDVGVSPDGIIWNIKTMNPRKERIKGHGYHYVSIRHREYAVHRLVAYAYGLIDSIDFDKQWHIDHINNDCSDNRLCNLQLLSASDNRDKESQLHRKQLPYEYVIYKEKIMYEEVVRLPSVLECAKFIGVDKSFISQVVNGKRKKCKGMVVRKVEKEK